MCVVYITKQIHAYIYPPAQSPQDFSELMDPEQLSQWLLNHSWLGQAFQKDIDKLRGMVCNTIIVFPIVIGACADACMV